MKKFIAMCLLVVLQACASTGEYKKADFADRKSSICRNTAVFQCEVIKK